MTSAIGKEDIEAALWSAGIRASHRVDKIMRLVEVYTLARIRDVRPLEDAPPVTDRFAHLAPGECSASHEVTRCLCCELVKDWKHFHADSGNSPSFRKRRCKTCLRERQGPRTYRCRGCDEDRRLDEFPPVKTEKPNSPVHCLSCQV